MKGLTKLLAIGAVGAATALTGCMTPRSGSNSGETNTLPLRESSTKYKISSYSVDPIKIKDDEGKDQEYLAKNIPANKTAVVNGERVDRGLTLNAYLIPFMDSEEVTVGDGISRFSSGQKYTPVNVEYNVDEGRFEINTDGGLEESIAIFSPKNLKEELKQRGKFVGERKFQKMVEDLPKLQINGEDYILMHLKLDIYNSDGEKVPNLNVMLLDSNSVPIRRTLRTANETVTKHGLQGNHFVPVSTERFEIYETQAGDSENQGPSIGEGAASIQINKKKVRNVQEKPAEVQDISKKKTE
tara:strand:+ start:33 stop:929 length:897 start_codon:yes stop_codon:yes gene_type:complete